MKYFKLASAARLCIPLSFALIPQIASADVGGMMQNLQDALLTVLAPLICIGGIIFSSFKLATGDESAKRTLFWSCIGTVICFTAPSLLSYLRDNVAG